MAEAGLLVIIADVSGSMAEAGKRMVVENVLTHVQQSIRYGSTDRSIKRVELVVWGGEITCTASSCDSEIAHLGASGRPTVRGLLDGLKQILTVSERPRLLLLSDGQFPKSELMQFASWRRTAPPLSFRAIAIGADANLGALGRIVDETGVFLAEDIVQTVDSWPFPAAIVCSPEGGVNSGISSEGSQI